MCVFCGESTCKAFKALYILHHILFYFRGKEGRGKEWKGREGRNGKGGEGQEKKGATPYNNDA